MVEAGKREIRWLRSDDDSGIPGSKNHFTTVASRRFVERVAADIRGVIHALLIFSHGSPSVAFFSRQSAGSSVNVVSVFRMHPVRMFDQLEFSPEL